MWKYRELQAIAIHSVFNIVLRVIPNPFNIIKLRIVLAADLKKSIIGVIINMQMFNSPKIIVNKASLSDESGKYYLE
jgi:hypothetical protein